MEAVTRITAENEVIEKIYQTLGNRTTICFMKCKNGFEVVGVAHCQDPANFDEEIGQVEAFKDGLDKIVDAMIFMKDEAGYRGLPDVMKERFN